MRRKKTRVVISPSEDDKGGIQTIEIFKSFDGGKTWSETMQDDYGHVISADTLAYAFRTSALYKVVVTDRFRTGIDAIVVQLDYVQPAPEGMLIGVENGGYTNAPVNLSGRTRRRYCSKRTEQRFFTRADRN